jgi:hypothetical protein
MGRKSSSGAFLADDLASDLWPLDFAVGATGCVLRRLGESMIYRGFSCRPYSRSQEVFLWTLSPPNDHALL